MGVSCFSKRWQLSVERKHGGQEKRKAEESLRRSQKPINRRERGLPEEREGGRGKGGVVGTDKTKAEERELQQLGIYIPLTSKGFKPSTY